MAVKIIICVCFLFLSTHTIAQNKIQLASPDGNIVFTVSANEAVPAYSISYKKNILIQNSSLYLDIEEMGLLQKAFITTSSPVKEINENYTLAVGKASLVNNHYRQTIISLQDKINPAYKINIEIKVFNDGLAFRYLFPKQHDKTSFVLLDEKTQFKFLSRSCYKSIATSQLHILT